MSMVGYLRRHLWVKLFLSYLVVIQVALFVLASAVELVLPRVFQRQILAMAETLGASTLAVERSLYLTFRTGANEALALAGIASFVVAVVFSVLLSRQVVVPVQEMMAASRRIADGRYGERVSAPGSQASENLDELGQLAVSFNQMAGQLQQVEAMRRELIGNVAHELRTPLSSIKGYLEGVIDGVLPAENATFQHVLREAERLERLVHDLEELSRFEARAFALNPRPVLVSRLTETARARLARQFEEKGIALDLDVPADLPPVLVDESRIGQVLLNLLGNALQYTPPGGRVQIWAREEASQICIAVQDTGIGIDAEHLPHVFARFYRVDKSRSRAGGGSGIGLTIAKHIVEAHGGTITAASDGLDRGSTFAFTLPLA